jgi:hypothetical protein
MPKEVAGSTTAPRTEREYWLRQEKVLYGLLEVLRAEGRLLTGIAPQDVLDELLAVDVRLCRLCESLTRLVKNSP